MRDEDYKTADTLTYHEDGGDTLMFKTLLAYRNGDIGRQKALLAAYKPIPNNVPRLVRMLAEEGEPDAVRAFMPLLSQATNKQMVTGVSASVAVGLGQASRANAMLRAADADTRGIRRRTWLAGMPYYNFSPAELAELRDDILKSDSTSGSGSDQIRPQTRLYQLAVVSCRMGQTSDAETYARRLEAMPAPSYYRDAVRAMANDTRAFIDVRNGNVKSALARIDAVSPHVPADLVNGAASRTLALIWRGELLLALGRLDEAQAWFENYSYSLPLFVNLKPFSAFRLAEIHDRKGEPQKAAQLYALALRYWSGDVDASVRPLVDQARRRLGAMQSRTN